MIYYTVAKCDYGVVIDSISEDLEALVNKFPQEKIYRSDEPVVSIYVNKNQLHEI